MIKQMLAVAVMSSTLWAQSSVREIPAMDVKNWPDVAAHHPAGDQLLKIFPAEGPLKVAESFNGTELTKKDYLTLIAGNVDFWKNYQNAAGAIIDPYEKKERQYATPAFALASAILVRDAGRADLLEISVRSMSFATAALANHTTADFHADFYIPMLMHARLILKDKVSADTLATWDKNFKSIVPEKSYHDIKAGGNWNLVQVSGEWERRKQGLVAEDQLAAQEKYLEQCMATQENRFTRFGMYEDPNSPLAYDAFPRLWLEDMTAVDAYKGPHLDKLQRFLTLGSFSGMLLVSPSGEWACGGRSAHHQWNEAENTLIAEINANRWKERGRDDIAGAFKRMAHLGLESMKRFQRPSGEMWIVKNFADPARRFGYEGYSFNSQYNLLPMGMLTMAYEHADDAIAERPIPSESSSYVFDARETFHKVCAAAGGYYVLIDTSADPHYNATGLQRVHRAGVALSPLTDSAAAERAFGPLDEKEKRALTVGIEWQESSGDWRSLAEYGIHQHENAPSKKDRPAPPPQTDWVKDASLKVTENSPQRVAFTIHYELSNARAVEEDYSISADGVEGATRILGEPPAKARFVFPALVNDGARDTDVVIDRQGVQITRKGAPLYKSGVENPGGKMTVELVAPAGLQLSRTGPQLVTHNGYVQAISADLPSGTKEIRWKLKLAAH